MYKAFKPYRDKMENRYQWCIAAVPGEKWAQKLFPELSKKQAIEKLWEKILMTSRVNEDPNKAWKEHNDELLEHCAYLTGLGIESLHYESSNGTDFTVGLIPRGKFQGGGERSRQGIYFNPNIPTEECFTSPMKGKADGIVYATKPLSYQGELIDKFWIRFKDGKAVEWDAQQGKELLTKMITMDENSGYLGECALVPYDSPINNSGILFYNTLFDENAVCHLAIGSGFNDCIQEFEKFSDEECKEMGINDSLIHVDFMIGSPDLSITAKCRDGRTVKIFENGNWAKR
jgi:aminopeptidase